MLRGYNCTEVIKNEKGVNEARNKTKTGGNEGMKKERKKVLLVWVMTLAMLFGVLQPAVGMNEVRAEEGTVSEQNEVGVKYEALPKEPMKTSATASSYQDSAQWGDGNASLAFDGDVNKGWHSQYDSKTGPHWIQWSLGGVHNIGRIAYQVKGTGANGRFKEIKVEVKNGEADWQTVKEETLADVGQGGSFVASWSDKIDPDISRSDHFDLRAKQILKVFQIFIDNMSAVRHVADGDF